MPITQTFQPTGLFVSGIMTAGKTTLINSLPLSAKWQVISASQLCRAPGIADLTAVMSKFNFASDIAETAYLNQLTADKLWTDVYEQSRALLPFISQAMLQARTQNKLVILEGLNMLPSLIAPLFNMTGVVLLAPDEQTVFNRLQQQPRFSRQPQLQRQEAGVLFDWLQPRLRLDAEQHHIMATTDNQLAKKSLTMAMTLIQELRRHDALIANE